MSDPSLAMGLSRFSYYTSPPFLNLMKQSKPAQIRGPDGNRLMAPDLVALGLLDKTGYPTRMPDWIAALPVHQRAYEYFVSLHHQNDHVARETAGAYVVTWRGAGTVALSDFRITRHTIFRDADGLAMGGEIRGHWPQSSRQRILKILDTDPHNPIRDLAVVKADHAALFDAGAVFDPRYLTLIEDSHTIRFMDWMGTQGSDVVSPADVMTLDAVSWVPQTVSTREPEIGPSAALTMPGHLPFAIMIELANQIGADPWFTLPLKADDAYIRHVAHHLSTHLRTDLIARIELSNEVWNWAYGFEQTREASLLGSDGKTAQSLQAARQFYGYRSAGIKSLIAEAAPNLRFEMTLATQTTHPAVTQWVADGVRAWFNHHGRNGEIRDVFDALAVTSYFEQVNHPDLTDLRAAWYDRSDRVFAAGLTPTRHAHFVARATDYLTRGVAALSADETALIRRSDGGAIRPDLLDPLHGHLRGHFARNAATARSWGLDLIQYEGGSHIAPHAFRADPEAEWFKALNLSPDMGDLMTLTADLFRAAGGTLVQDYGHLGDTDFGLWGSRRHLADQNPISRAYDHYNIQAAARFGSLNTTRPEGTFRHGRRLSGTHGADRLLGSVKADSLVGGPGPDLFVGGSGDDRINGGDGIDVAVFGGRRDAYTFAADASGRVRVIGPFGTDHLANVELIVFAETREVLRTSDLSGTPAIGALDGLRRRFAAGNPHARWLGW